MSKKDSLVTYLAVVAFYLSPPGLSGRVNQDAYRQKVAFDASPVVTKVGSVRERGIPRYIEFL